MVKRELVIWPSVGCSVPGRGNSSVVVLRLEEAWPVQEWNQGQWAGLFGKGGRSGLRYGALHISTWMSLRHFKLKTSDPKLNLWSSPKPVLPFLFSNYSAGPYLTSSFSLHLHARPVFNFCQFHLLILSYLSPSLHLHSDHPS